MKLHLLVIQYDCGILYQSAYVGLVMNFKNRTSAQIKYHGKIIYKQKKSKEMSWLETYGPKNSKEL